MLRHFLYSMHCFLVGLLCICIFSGCDNNTNNIKDLKILSVELANDLSQDILINTNASLINNTTTFLSTKAINIISNNKQTLNVSCSTLASAIRCKTSGAITNTEYTLTVRNLIGSIGSNNAAQTKEFQYQFKTNQVINVYNSSINPNNSSSDLLRSIDGVNWTNTLMNANYSNVFYMSNHNIIMTSDNGITISNNIFTTNVKYNNIKLPLLNSDISDSDIKINSWASDSDNVVVGVGGNTNSAVLVYSTDAGASWSEVKINNLSKPLVAIANGSLDNNTTFIAFDNDGKYIYFNIDQLKNKDFPVVQQIANFKGFDSQSLSKLIVYFYENYFIVSEYDLQNSKSYYSDKISDVSSWSPINAPVDPNTSTNSGYITAIHGAKIASTDTMMIPDTKIILFAYYNGTNSRLYKLTLDNNGKIPNTPTLEFINVLQSDTPTLLTERITSISYSEYLNPTLPSVTPNITIYPLIVFGTISTDASEGAVYYNNTRTADNSTSTKAKWNKATIPTIIKQPAIINIVSNDSGNFIYNTNNQAIVYSKPAYDNNNNSFTLNMSQYTLKNVAKFNQSLFIGLSNAISVGDNSSVALTNSVGIGNNLPESWFLPGVALNNKFFVRPAGVSFNSMTSGLLNLHNYNKQVPVQLLVGQNNLIAYSSDNNNSWFIIPTDFTDTNDFNLVKCGLDASNNGVCVAVSKANNTHPARIYYTHDAITWTEATLNVTLTNNVNMNDLNFITDTSNTNYFILAGDNGNLLYSKDGVHWQKLNDDSINNMNLSSSSFAKINNKDLLIMSGNDSNAKSYMVSCEITSTGLFCKSSLPLDDTLINKTFVNTMANKTRLFVIGSKTTNNITTPLVKYSDNGDSWQDANIVNSSGLGHVSSITASAQNILISIDSGSSSVVYSSSNGDVFNKNALSIIPDDNFTLALNKNSSIEYISSLGKFIFLTSNNGVFLTNDANPLPEKKWTRYLTNNTGVAPVFLSKNLIY